LWLVYKLQKGDVIKLQDCFNQWYTYKIDDFSIIDVKKALILALITEDNLLIIKYYPFNDIRSGTPLRYVVSASS